MPELPEVETIRTQLADKLIGRKIVDVQIRLAKIWEGDKSDVVGQKIKDVRRRAKILIISLENGLNVVVHLKMTGQLVYGESRHSGKYSKSTHPESPGGGVSDSGHGQNDEGFTAQTISFSQGIPFTGFSLPGKTTHVIIKLDKGTLFFNDMRQFGWMRVVDNDELDVIDGKHGPDALGKDFTPEYLAKICANWGRPIKLLLMEQGKIAGIGNIYANEALWEAGISPMKRGREIPKEKIKDLHQAIQKVLEMGLKYGGSSAADEAFVNVLGEKGHMQEHFVVYQKQKTKCPRCGGTITVSRIGGRGTFFCPKCQD